MTTTLAADLEVICDGGRPLWPERWSLLWHGTYCYRITAIRLDSVELDGTEAVIMPAGPVAGWSWYVPRSRKLCVNGRDYRRRQLARTKRKRR